MIRLVVLTCMSWMMVLFFLAPLSTSAHSMPTSAVFLDFSEKNVTAELVIPIDRLEVAFDHNLTDEPEKAIKSYHKELVSYITNHISVKSPEGTEWSIQIGEMSVSYPEVTTDPTDLIVSTILTPPSGAPVDSFTLNYEVVVRELITHVSTLTIRSDWNNGIYTSEPQLIANIIHNNTTVQINQSKGNTWSGFTSIVKSGMAHIAEGVDHLLFLLALLLPAPLLVKNNKWDTFAGVKPSLKKLLKITFAFTIGHSITLIIGSTGWVSIPSQPIEILIAISILISAIHAIRPIFAGREIYVASGFGLVHGLAFATLVTDLGVTPMRIVLSVLGFNIGIELMQLFVIALIMPWLLLLSVTKAYRSVRMVGALFAIAASIGWILDRAFAISTPVDTIVNALAQNVIWVVVILALFSIINIYFTKTRRASITRN
ncbi:HupE/UreJ family protein [Paenibacillus wulumuqiensis]|uniref:HupE/UreJ family protein n=1 Tax=Paenibacillus wulumuqiensis TaxID=1567107 RepID=UPI000619E77E|nr:HupE/UreJ family protein [Paenibacillus wulumuqiensis]